MMVKLLIVDTFVRKCYTIQPKMNHQTNKAVEKGIDNTWSLNIFDSLLFNRK